jgi:arginase
MWVLGSHARRARMRFGTKRAREFWVHFDADVLDDAIMPAVAHRQPAGLTWAEIEDALSAALAHSRAVGMEITIFNAKLDTDGILLSTFFGHASQCLFPKQMRKLFSIGGSL